jgi:hypothetical protein
MINIAFKIEESFEDRSQPHSLVAGVEGRLSIEVDGNVFSRARITPIGVF